MNSFPHFKLLFDNVFFFFFFALSQNTDTRLRMEHARFITYAETLGSYHKVNSYYDYYM